MPRLAKAVADCRRVGHLREGDRETDVVAQLAAQRVEVEAIVANEDGVARVANKISHRARRFRYC
eukprot:3169975-Pleurochrysis_carterae.AAC.1